MFVTGDKGAGSNSLPSPFMHAITVPKTNGRVPKRSTGSDCKSDGFGLRRFESYLAHQCHTISAELMDGERMRKRIVCPDDLIDNLCSARDSDEHQNALALITRWVDSNINELAIGDEFVLPHPITFDMITSIKHREGGMIQ
jgi:hypothetical protein